MSEKTYVPFAIAAGIWLLTGGFLSWYFGPQEWSVFYSAAWFCVLWTLCVLDLITLSKAIQAAFRLIGQDPNYSGEVADQKRPALIVQAFYWGFIKLACLGTFTVILMRAQQIPSSSLLLGLGTLVVVPIFGGFWWSKRELHHA
jgi:hypothetical protein